MKPISSSMFAIEPAPWRHADGAQKLVKVPSSTRNVHSEIEKRLKDSDLKQSEKNLRPLKHILEGTQAKEPLERVSMYISEILLASGLLLEDLASGSTTFQLHSSAHPINPELFFFLERTKASSLLSSHRKLIFDLVNEILGGKLALVGGSGKTLNAENLLKELCMEIQQLQAKKSNSDTEEEGDLNNILLEDVICQSESWFGFNGEISGMVLDIERLVFKDLINEAVIGEEGLLRSNQQQRRHQHQLLSKKSNVVAKLMGLGPLPDSSSADDVHLGAVKTGCVVDNNPFLQPLRSNNSNKPTRTSNCVRSLLKDPTSPMKPISSSRFLIEPAPWRHADGARWEPPKHVNVPSKNPNSFPSIYSEIEKRLKDLELKQSGKDLRALKHVLEAMQAKGLLETEKEEETANLVSQRDCEPKCTSPGPNLRGQRRLQSTRVNNCSEDGAAVIEAWCSGDENKALGRLDDAYVAPGRELSHTHLQRILVRRSNQLDVQLHSSNASGFQPNSRSRDEFQRHSPNYYGDLQQCLQSPRVNTCSEDGAAVIEALYSGDENKALGRLDDAYVAPGLEISHTHLQRILVGRSNKLDVQLHSSNASGFQPNSRSRDEFQRHSPNYYGDLQQCSATSRKYSDLIWIRQKTSD